jgi:hypothetical protein
MCNHAFREGKNCFCPTFTPKKLHFTLPPMNRSTFMLHGRRKVSEPLEKYHLHFQWQARGILAVFDFLGGVIFPFFLDMEA